MNGEKKITLGISTISARRDGAERIAAEVAHLFDEVLVVVQRSDVESEDKVGNVLTILTRSSGLSRSRNTLLSRASSQWLWIADDDVEILPQHVTSVKMKLANSGGSVLFAGRIGSTVPGERFKNYKYRWIAPLLFAQVSSIEIIVDRSWCVERSIEFDVGFGLGTNRPVAEEPIFASDIMRQGGRMRDIGFVTILHPPIDTKAQHQSIWADSMLSNARGQAASRIGGVRGFIVVLFMLSSALLRGKSYKSALSVLEGYQRYV